MRPNDLLNALTFAIEHKLPILIKGAPGVGKSDIVASACKKAGAELIVSHPVVSDPTDYKGLPFPSADSLSAEFLPFGDLQSLISASVPTVYFLDDLGQAPMSVQAACFPSGTEVMTPSGVVAIETIQEGDTVIDGYGSPRLVTETFVRDSSSMVSISAVGVLPIVCTKEHPILVSSGSKKNPEDGTWKQASDIVPGDWIALPVPKPYIDIDSLTISTSGQTTRSIKLSHEFAELCGFYAGDGWFTQHKSVESVGFALDNKYPDIQERLISLIGTVLDTKVYVQKYKNHSRIQFHDKGLGLFLSEQIGSRATNKKIPDWILYNKDIEIVARFIRGYYYTDGAELKSGGVKRGIQFTTVSKSLAMQTQQAILRFGSVAPVKNHSVAGRMMYSPRDGKLYDMKESYIIQCSDTRLLDAIGESYDTKRRVSWSYEHNGMLWTRVKEVKEDSSGIEKVYNLEVEETHTYTVNNVCVHNCMQLILARRINEHKVSDHVVFFAATNRRADKAGVTGILEPVKSRFAAILELNVELEDWVEWAAQNNMPPELISFIRFMPGQLHDFTPTADIQNSPCPRTVANVGKILNGLKTKSEKVASSIRSRMIEGAAGAGFAANFEAFLNVYAKLPTFPEFLKDAKKLPVPEDPALLYAYCGFIAGNVKANTFDAAMEFISRMPIEFQVLAVKDSAAKSKSITAAPSFGEWSIKNTKTFI